MYDCVNRGCEHCLNRCLFMRLKSVGELAVKREELYASKESLASSNQELPLLKRWRETVEVTQ